jgi:hypothetical protein
MMKKVVLFVLIAVFAANIFAQNQQKPFDFSEYGIKIEPDKRLIVVMAALETAGLEIKKDSELTGKPAVGLETDLSDIGKVFRQELRSDLESTPSETRKKLKIFFEQYKRRFATKYKAELSAKEQQEFKEDNPKFQAALITPFVSLAYALGPTPELSDPYKTDDLPGDLLEVFDFAPLVREFYRKSNIELKLPRYIQIYNEQGDKMRPSARIMTLELLDYLHTRPQLAYLDKTVTTTKVKGKTLSKTEIRERERRFFIVPDLLAPLGTINFRNVGDDYYVVVPPNTNLLSSEARRAYLQFVFDALVLKNAKDVTPFRAGIKELLAKQDASPDVFLAMIRSLVSAADAKQTEYVKYEVAKYNLRNNPSKNKPEEVEFRGKKATKLADGVYLIDNKFVIPSVDDETALQLSEDYEKGAVLSFYFAEQFKGLEDSGFDIAGSFRDMLLSLDTTKEANRLAQSSEARKRALQARKDRRDKAKSAMQNSQTEVTKEDKFITRMKEAENVIKVKNYERAENALAELMKDFPEYQARIFYAQGRLASLSATEAIDETIRNERLERAAAGYRNAILASGNTEDALRSQAHVALGEILEFNDQLSAALKEYEAAIKIGNIKESAFQKANAGKMRLTKKP